MDSVLSAILRLLHPFMPHITEELWALLGLGEGTIQFVAPPQANTTAADKATTARARVAALYNTVRVGRNLRAESRVPSNKKVPFILRTPQAWVADEVATIARLLSADQFTIEATYEAAKGVPVAMTDLGELYLLAEMNADAGAERERLEKEIAKLEKELEATVRKLSNSSFTDKAPPEVVAEHQQRKVDFAEKLKQPLCQTGRVICWKIRECLCRTRMRDGSQLKKEGSKNEKKFGSVSSFKAETFNFG